MMLKTFTICANNYLAHAKTLLDSFKRYHPTTPFYIALVDERHPDIDYKALGADGILFVHELMGDDFKNLAATYNIAELCTVVKPWLFRHLFEKHEATSVIYLDPDIEVFSEFREVFDRLKNDDLVLTPHICSPTGETGHPLDKDLMRTGIYNLGFVAMNKNVNILKFIDWWKKRVKEYGYHNLCEGHFYDQIWLGYAPAFLEKVTILRHLGYNVANWNLHERKIVKEKGMYYVNDVSTPLRFFHFSHFNIYNLPEIASYNENYSLENRPDIVSLFTEYKNTLIANGYEHLNTIEYFYGKKPRPAARRGRIRLFARHMFLGLRAATHHILLGTKALFKGQ